MENGSPAVIQSEAAKMEALFTQNADLMKQMGALKSKVDVLQAEKMQKGMPLPVFNEAKVLSFEEHLQERGIKNLDAWNDKVAQQMESERSVGRTAMTAMSKSLANARLHESNRKILREAPEYKTMRKAMSSGSTADLNQATLKFEEMAKSVLGGPNSSGEAGSAQAWLQENLSSLALRIILTSADCQAIESISTAITSSINPETPVLESTGSGYAKGTLGFIEGGTPVFGGGSIKNRIAKTLVQRGVKASVTELLKANRGKLVGYDPLMEERTDRMIERNLMINHLLIYGDENINKNGTEIQEMSGIVQQLENSDAASTNIRDWNGKVLNDTNSAIDIFRDAAETLIKVGKIPGGDITGRFTTLLDYGVGNQLSKLIDDKQRILMDYKKLGVNYGQQFSGVNTDLGVFRFKRTRTLELVQGNKWTPTAQVSPHAITWPAITPTAAGQTANGVVVEADGVKALPIGKYYYKVSVVNDHGESVVSASFTNGSDITADQEMLVSIPYDAAFAGGTVGGYVVSPARFFIIYRGRAGEGDVDATMYPIAKVPINGTSTTTYDDFDQKIPNHTDILFISNNPLDVAHTSLIPPKEIPIYDPSLATSTIWSIYDIANLTLWAPSRVFLVKNVPGGVTIQA